MTFSLCRRFCCHLRHHQLYQHLQPLRDAGGGAPGQERGGAGAGCGTLRQDQPLPRQRGGHLLPAGERSGPLPGEAGVSQREREREREREITTLIYWVAAHYVVVVSLLPTSPSPSPPQVPPGGLWLYDLHRQQRPSAGGGGGGH